MAVLFTVPHIVLWAFVQILLPFLPHPFLKLTGPNSTPRNGILAKNSSWISQGAFCPSSSSHKPGSPLTIRYTLYLFNSYLCLHFIASPLNPPCLSSKVLLLMETHPHCALFTHKDQVSRAERKGSPTSSPTCLLQPSDLKAHLFLWLFPIREVLYPDNAFFLLMALANAT